MAFTLNYDNMLFLDAEDLAEAGIKKAYDSLARDLARYISPPAEVWEIVDNDAPSYVVRCGDQEYLIYSSEVSNDEGQSWGRAAYAFFKIVNDQLTKSEHRLYAINGGKELGAMFLTQSECETERRSLPGKGNWPYLPTLDPWYGQYHD